MRSATVFILSATAILAAIPTACAEGDRRCVGPTKRDNESVYGNQGRGDGCSSEGRSRRPQSRAG